MRRALSWRKSIRASIQLLDGGGHHTAFFIALIVAKPRTPNPRRPSPPRPPTKILERRHRYYSRDCELGAGPRGRFDRSVRQFRAELEFLDGPCPSRSAAAASSASIFSGARRAGPAGPPCPAGGSTPCARPLPSCRPPAAPAVEVICELTYLIVTTLSGPSVQRHRYAAAHPVVVDLRRARKCRVDADAVGHRIAEAAAIPVSPLK